MSWQPPESDGGSPITGYLIEKREKVYSRWTQVEKTADDSTSAILKRLVPGSELTFRVAAINKQGTSDALEMPRPITVKSPFGKNALRHGVKRLKILITELTELCITFYCKKCYELELFLQFDLWFSGSFHNFFWPRIFIKAVCELKKCC